MCLTYRTVRLLRPSTDIIRMRVVPESLPRYIFPFRLSPFASRLAPMSEFDALLTENRKFPPPDAFRRQAHVSDDALYAAADADYEQFWADQAERVEWYRK